MILQTQIKCQTTEAHLDHQINNFMTKLNFLSRTDVLYNTAKVIKSKHILEVVADPNIKVNDIWNRITVH